MNNSSRATVEILADSSTLSSLLVVGVDPIRDLKPHPDDEKSDSDSFYVLSYLEGGGRRFTLLFHLILLNKPPGPASLLDLSVLDETDDPPQFYFSKEETDLALKRTSVSKDRLDIQVFRSEDRKYTLGHLSGTANKLMVEGSASDVSGTTQLEIALMLSAFGPTLPDLATGVIPFPEGLNYEYAFPRMNTSGTLTVKGVTYQVTGSSWLDREWGHCSGAKWTWMGIGLDNGVLISLWDQQNYEKNPHTYVGGQAFATHLDSDDNITITTVRINEHAVIPARDGRPMYPDSWKVTFPGKDTLEVKTLKEGQAIDSIIPRLEAKSRVTGIYNGKNVTGTGFVEAGVIPFPGKKDKQIS
jgi:predicted secreted hydrolase